ncbi:hypothetical protein WS90_00020 [Burkholderia cepacia]|uniref:Pilus assembly protein n=1 Tax=Burkholderia cepacia TaxID=292 RepID=A0A118KKV0_BURCE|nr:hypothetical protein [Burkholderia cepacia]KVK85769.1 hypothetical protein WS90_00020 [Burkholderia cepacia]
MKQISSILRGLCAAVCLSVSTASFAEIDLMQKEVTVAAKATTVRVANNGGQPEYVSISLSRLLNPGVPLDDERLEPIGDSKQPSLYAYPFRMTLAPGQTKTITLKPTRAVETETVYRLDVKPVVKMQAGEHKRAAASIVVNLGFSGLVRQLPGNERRTLAVACEAGGARVSATGNVRYRVEDVEVDGRKIDDFNVYPGVPLPVHGRVVTIPGHPACDGHAG